ncbi:MAG: hypothetical protein U0900_18390 [Myxococcota bacterium]
MRPRSGRDGGAESDRAGARVLRLETGRRRIGMPLSEGVREVVLTLLVSLAFGLGWAAIEAGQANSALAGAGIPAAGPRATDAAPGAGTGYAQAAMERR